MLSYVLIVLFSFSSVFIGAFLARKSPEEMPTARLVLPLLARFILAATLVYAARAVAPGPLLAVLLGLAGIAYALLIRNLAHAYVPLAVLMTLSAASPYVLQALASLIFLFGIPVGTVFAAARKEPFLLLLKNTALHHGVYPLAALILPFVVSKLL